MAKIVSEETQVQWTVLTPGGGEMWGSVANLMPIVAQTDLNGNTWFRDPAIFMKCSDAELAAARLNKALRDNGIDTDTIFYRVAKRTVTKITSGWE